MEAKKKLLTYAGLKALEDELENLKVVKRREIAQKIKEAREQGDLSENAEYDAAKDEHFFFASICLLLLFLFHITLTFLCLNHLSE